jgi:cytidylate kinase
MTSIVVSSNDTGLSQFVGKRVAKALDYTLVGPSLLEQVAEQHGVSEDKLHRVIDPGESWRYAAKSRNLLSSYIQAMALQKIQQDSVVCVGLKAHLYTRNISHVLMVRIISSDGARAAALVKQKKISARKATKLIAREREQRIRWSMDLFSINEEDPSWFDLVINHEQIGLEKVVEVITDMTSYRKFRPMSFSRKCLNDLVLAAKLKSLLLSRYPDIVVRADGDVAIIHVRCSKRQKQAIAAGIKKITCGVPEIKLTVVHAVKSIRDLAEQQRLKALSSDHV